MTISALTVLAEQLTEDISAIESRQRKRTADQTERFIYSLTKILTDVWRGIHISPEYQSHINKRSNAYFGDARYRDPNFTYRSTMVAFTGLHMLNLITVSSQNS